VLRYPTQAKTWLEWGTEPWVGKENCKGRPALNSAVVTEGLKGGGAAGCPFKPDIRALYAPLFVVRSEAENPHFFFPPTASGTTNYATAVCSENNPLPGVLEMIFC
jgi:hypothetical protein